MIYFNSLRCLVRARNKINRIISFYRIDHPESDNFTRRFERHKK